MTFKTFRETIIVLVIFDLKLLSTILKLKEKILTNLKNYILVTGNFKK